MRNSGKRSCTAGRLFRNDSESDTTEAVEAFSSNAVKFCLGLSRPRFILLQVGAAAAQRTPAG